MTMNTAQVAPPTSREAMRADVEAAERDLGRAVLDGRKPDHDALRAARAHLEALDNAEAERHRRQATAATKAEAERRTTAKARIGELAKAMLAAVAGAERSAREMVEQLRTAEAAAAGMCTAFASLGVPPPVQIAKSEVERRLSRQLAFMLARPPAWEWGALEWNSLPDGLGDWTEAERAALGAALIELPKEP